MQRNNVLHCKSGFNAKKYLLRFSTGTRRMFLNPIDALHGDIGLLWRVDPLGSRTRPELPKKTVFKVIIDFVTIFLFLTGLILFLVFC